MFAFLVLILNTFFGPELQNYLFKVKFDIETNSANSNMQNSLLVSIASLLDKKCPFQASLVLINEDCPFQLKSGT